MSFSKSKDSSKHKEHGLIFELLDHFRITVSFSRSYIENYSGTFKKSWLLDSLYRLLYIKASLSLDKNNEKLISDYANALIDHIKFKGQLKYLKLNYSLKKQMTIILSVCWFIVNVCLALISYRFNFFPTIVIAISGFLWVIVLMFILNKIEKYESYDFDDSLKNNKNKTNSITKD